MASNFSNPNTNTTCFDGQYTCLPSTGSTQCGLSTKTNLKLTEVPSFSSETSLDSILSPNHTFMNDFQFPMQYYNDLELSVSNEENDSVSSTSNLLTSSKKIQKSPQGQSASLKESRRRPNRKRNDWRPEEDAKLLELMKEYGQAWAMISSKLPGRTGKQVRDRYVNNLVPGIRCGGWTPEEDQIILSLRNVNGNRWSYIASRLPGRTEAQVKNRFYSYIKKRSISDFPTVSKMESYQNTENNFSSPMTSHGIEMDFEEEIFEAGTTVQGFENFTESSGFIMQNVEEKDTVNGLVTSVGSIINEDRISYGNIIRIPCFTGRPETLKEPLENPLLTGSWRSSSKCCAVEDMFMSGIDDEGQVDELLNRAVSCTMECGSVDPYDVEKFFADDLSENEMKLQQVLPEAGCKSKSSQREMELRKNKVQLEMMLAAVMKEMEDLTRSDL